MNYGKIVEAPFLMSEFVGEANDGKNQYEMLAMLKRNPAIRNKTNGKVFILEWEDIFALARQAGIDAPKDAVPK